jgi:NTP pyrophosphatase (non-canonical NTP hydrolase)
MSLSEKQKDVDDWVGQYNPKYFPALEQLTCLTEEVGEVARELNHLHGNKKKKDSEDKKELSKELIDVIFTIICIANNHEIDLEKEWHEVMEKKFYGRDKDRFQKKESF